MVLFKMALLESFSLPFFPSESEPPVDWTFYQMFWGLQSYFLNPIKAFEAWPVVAGHLTSVLDLFKQYPISEEVPTSFHLRFCLYVTQEDIPHSHTGGQRGELQLRQPAGGE